jgi:hypothetical protein
MALSLTKEVEAPVVSNTLLNKALDNIYTLYLSTGKKAKAYVTSVINLGNACAEFDKVIGNLGYNGMPKRAYYKSISDRIGFGYNQFMKFKQIAEAVEIVDKKEEYKALSLIDADDESGFHLLVDGERVPATIDNIHKGIGNTKGSDNQSTTDSAEAKKVSQLEALIQKFEDLKEKMTSNQISELESNEQSARDAEQRIKEFREAEELAKTNKKNAQEDYDSALKEMRILKSRATKFVKKSKAEEEKEAKAKEDSANDKKDS